MYFGTKDVADISVALLVADDFGLHAAWFERKPIIDVAVHVALHHSYVDLRGRILAIHRLQRGCVSGEHCGLPLFEGRERSVRGLSTRGDRSNRERYEYR